MVVFEKYTLSNGLRVILHNDTATPLAVVNILYNVGSRDENENHTGLAHLFEHLMFGGTKNIKDFDIVIQKAGGENNAYTNQDVTNYYNVVPAENLETALWVESDRMHNLKLTDKLLRVQKKVVIEEFKETTINEPYGDVWHHLGELVYKTSSYRWPVIGLNFDHVAQTTMTDAENFYARFYAPNNAVLSVAGNFNRVGGVQSVKDWIEKWYADIPFSKTFTKPEYTLEAEQTARREKKVEAKVPAEVLYMAFPSVARLEKNYYALDLCTDILAGGTSSRLYQNLVKNKQIFSEIDCYQTGSIDTGLIIIEGKPLPNIGFETAEKYIWEEINSMKSDLIQPRELAKLKNLIESQNTFSDAGIMNKSMNLAFYELIGDINLINTESENYNLVTAEEIQTAAQYYFAPQRVSVLRYQPADIVNVSEN